MGKMEIKFVHRECAIIRSWRIIRMLGLTLSLFTFNNDYFVTGTSAASLPFSSSLSEAKKLGVEAGNIGCLFGKTLCDPDLEWCYDDYAFGRCLPKNERLSEEDLYRYDLSKGDMHTLQKQMERLFAMGYRWGHLYTQCILQNLLETIRHGSRFDESICMVVQDQDLEGALKAFQEDIDPWNLAFIKFSPSAKNPHSQYADETYKPSKQQSHLSSVGSVGSGEGGGREVVAGKEILTQESLPEGLSLKDKLNQPFVDLPENQREGLSEKELETALAQMKETNRKGKGKSNKSKNRNKQGKTMKQGGLVAKKSLLNVELPGQSDNFNGVDIGSNKKKGSGRWDESRILESLINKDRQGDAVRLEEENSGLDPNGDVNEGIINPRIFSGRYNSPDSFRFGEDEEESWKDLGESLPGELGFRSLGAAPGDGDEEELRAEEEELIGRAVATLEAEALLQSLLNKNKYDEDPENGLRDQESFQQIASSSPQLPLDIQGLPALSMGEEEEGYPYTNPNGLLNDGDLLYTEGGLVFMNKPPPQEPETEASHFRERALEESGIGDQGLNLYKRRSQDIIPPAELEEDPEVWGPMIQDGGDEGFLQGIEGDESPVVPEEDGDLIPPRSLGLEEYVDTYGYEYGSPFLFLNRRSRDGWGFERRERLDVKKPGPWYRTVNNYAFDKADNEERRYHPHGDPNPEFGAAEGPADMPTDFSDADENVPIEAEKILEQQNEQQMNKEKKSAEDKLKSSLPASVSFDDGHYDIIDTSYANLFLDKRIDWNTAKNLVDTLAYAMDIDRTSFKEITVNNEVVTFKVDPNDKGWNATEVARRIQMATRNGNIDGDLGVKILKADAGIRASSKTPSVLPLMYDDQDPISNQIYVATFAVCGLVAAVLVAAVAIFLIRKHSKSRDKLRSLSQDESNFEACKDYQDLCRARMAGSKNNEKMEPIRGPAHKIASKESENGTNSSRSSTSSWSEEPVLTNMDISTGHMVLSYMEDHLKNRDRMDKEWGALCAYEADPCSTAVAEKSENSKKNRYSNSLPFDHSRVILNDLVNLNGSDYINASTITDHDPRNPAYIATQGPLPHTAADFWQMVWEQGSVVIVNLTKLNENNTALCHRYWPEEGSELHHIYEVHLVSEHIWCDEYLVRSFYLKNLKTGETRTVTQFHFLAWPESGIPQSTKALLEFRRKVNKSYRGRSCPIIVHCSDGAGRTGTYCLIDMVLNRMTKGAKEIDIAASLEHIRDQRPGMVRTKQQFEFVLMAVAEEVHAILKALPQ